MRPIRTERVICRETAEHIFGTAKSNKKANFRRELALLNATTEPKFHGQVIIESRQDATVTANTAGNSQAPDGARQLVFFVDGSRPANNKNKRKRMAPESQRASGAAVVYKTNEQGWEERTFTLARGNSSQSAEMAAIAEGLAIALSQILLLGSHHRQGQFKVIIFTDCQVAMNQVDGLRRISLAEGRLRSDPIVRKLVTRSQYLRGLGVQVEIRWVPGHSGVEGNDRAHAAAQSAAWRIPGLANGVYLDEGLRLIELELTRQDEGHGQQYSMGHRCW